MSESQPVTDTAEIDRMLDEYGDACARIRFPAIDFDRGKQLKRRDDARAAILRPPSRTGEREDMSNEITAEQLAMWAISGNDMLPMNQLPRTFHDLHARVTQAICQHAEKRSAAANVDLASRVERLERLIGMQPGETLEAAEERMRLQGDCFVALEQENERQEALLWRCRKWVDVSEPWAIDDDTRDGLLADIDRELRGETTPE